MKKLRWLLSVFLTLTLLVGSLAGAMAETALEGGSAPTPPAGDGGGSGEGDHHDHGSEPQGGQPGPTATPAPGPGASGTDSGDAGGASGTGTGVEGVDSIEIIHIPSLTVPTGVGGGASLDSGSATPRVVTLGQTYEYDVGSSTNPGTLTVTMTPDPNHSGNFQITLVLTLAGGNNAGVNPLEIYVPGNASPIYSSGNEPWTGQGNTGVYTLVIDDIDMQGQSLDDGWMSIKLKNIPGTGTIEVGKPHTHAFVATTGGTPSTCKVAGTLREKCSACGEIQTRTAPLAPHNAGAPQVSPASCGTAGSSVVRCTACNDQISATAIQALTHTWEKQNTSTEANCEAAGELVEKCTTPGGCQGIQRTAIQALTHTWEKDVNASTAATCGDAGQLVENCTTAGGCRGTQRTNVAKLDHNWVDDSTPATCVSDGLQKEKCTNGCAGVNTLGTIPKLPHIWVIPGTNAAGHTCSVCSSTESHHYGPSRQTGNNKVEDCGTCQYQKITPLGGGQGEGGQGGGAAGAGLLDIGDQQTPLGLDFPAARMLDQNFQVIQTFTLGQVVDGQLRMNSDLQLDQYIYEISYDALVYLSYAYPGGEFMARTGNMSAEIPFALFNQLGGLAQRLQTEGIPSAGLWLRLTFANANGWTAKLSAQHEGNGQLDFGLGGGELGGVKIK